METSGLELLIPAAHRAWTVSLRDGSRGGMVRCGEIYPVLLGSAAKCGKAGPS